ncbi:hypothetical protein [Salinisphaera aquimarina]|uniref:Uncharacterized protein n=1 Tax=Salinisphaera aquimarina TaxID=2094031 RepID=A0ABV7EMC2_9GAMM
MPSFPVRKIRLRVIPPTIPRSLKASSTIVPAGWKLLSVAIVR